MNDPQVVTDGARDSLQKANDALEILVADWEARAMRFEEAARKALCLKHLTPAEIEEELR